MKVVLAAVRWDLVVLAALATVATAWLFLATVRSSRAEEKRGERPRRDRRRRSRAGRPDPREALALVGDALAATHNPRALLPVILDVVTEATGARGGRLLRNGEELGWVGEAGGRGELRLALSADDDASPVELVLYPPHEGFPAETRGLAEWLASQAAVALENARLHDVVQRQAVTDDLTGLANRRRFMAVLDAEIERAVHGGSGLAVVLIDLDDFKLVNDNAGHDSGDRVLVAFGTLLERHVRDVDLAARLGGEEFAVVLPDAGLDGAVATANRLSRALAERPLPGAGGREIGLTASCGVVHFVPGDTSEELLRLADRALYRAKGEGKNRVCVAREGRAA